MVNQPITITNSDPTTHNIHFTPKNNPDWNQSQANGAAPLTHKLARAEVMVPVKCNQHPWMKSYVGVTKHPFFAVTGEDGSFTIRSEEHTSELQSLAYLVCRLLLEKKKK